MVPQNPPATIARRHDLDALRGVAMLLGIVLHGVLAFIPFAWMVQDPQANQAWGLLLAAIHGFRMPLFFLISGFFTAMLWRKRGLGSLLGHRFKRIFLPMVLGLMTIIPATWIVTDYVTSPRQRGTGTTDGETGRPAPRALITAVAVADSNSVERLIEQGADLEASDDWGSTPLHVACFFGRARSAKMLLDAGADTDALNKAGERPAELLRSPWQATKSIADLVNVEVERRELFAGRKEIAELMKVPLPTAPSGDFDLKGESGGSEAIAGLVGLLNFPLFGHLWFLWFLCWLVLGFALLVKLGSAMNLPNPPQWITLSRWRYLWLIPLTAVPQFFMEGFGPDTSLGLVPRPVILIYYAIFFGFGALYFDTHDNSGKLGKRWWLTLPTALFVVFPIAIALLTQTEGPGRVGFVFLTVAYTWLVTFGMMGLFRWILSTESQAMRYLSDSSYWLYLAHIPLIILVQYAVLEWPIPALIKLPLVCIVTSALLLISYHLFVRYTPLGTLLNGPRRRPSKPEEPVEAVVT